MIRRLLSLGLVVAFAAPLPVLAVCGDQSVELTVLSGDPRLALTPAQPGTHSPIGIEIGMASIQPIRATATVSETTITVTLIGSYIGFIPPPLTCASTRLPALPTGHYDIDVLLTQPV